VSLDVAEAARDAVGKTGRTHRLIEWPGDRGRTLGLVVLTEEEFTFAAIAAARYLRNDLKLDPIEMALTQSDLLLERARDVFLLATALRDPRHIDVPAFDAAALRQSITTEERIALMQLYNKFVEDTSPLTDAPNPEGLFEEVIALGKDEAQWTWVQCSGPDTLRSIAMFMLRRLQPLPSDSSSDT